MAIFCRTMYGPIIERYYSREGKNIYIEECDIKMKGETFESIAYSFSSTSL